MRTSGLSDYLLPVRSIQIWSTPHDDVMKWKHFPRYWPFMRGIYRSSVNSPHKGQWRGALMFSLICVWINSWINNREAGDLRRHGDHYDVIVMITPYHKQVIVTLFVFIGWTCHMFGTASQITSNLTLCSTVYSGFNQRKRQSSAPFYESNPPVTCVTPDMACICRWTCRCT